VIASWGMIAGEDHGRGGVYCDDHRVGCAMRTGAGSVDRRGRRHGSACWGGRLGKGNGVRGGGAGAQYHVVCTTCLIVSRDTKYCILQKNKYCNVV
jgi:hypothetical protein